MKNFIGAASFSSPTMENIRRSLELSESIRTVPNLEKTGINLDGLLMAKAQTERAPFEYLGEKIEKLESYMSKISEFLPVMNKTQLGISSEIKVSGQTATQLAKWSIGLNVLILFVTGFGVWASFKVSELSNLQIEVKVLRESLSKESEINSKLQDSVALLEKKLNVRLSIPVPKPTSEQGK